MKKLFTIVLFLAALTAKAQLAVSTVTFNFNEPETLYPELYTPEVKDFISLDGREFVAGDVTVSFENAESGNTHVRLYKPYDIDGCDLRIYDGDRMIVSCANRDLIISEIQFTMSLSGAATGSNDINFIPSTGEFVWEQERWIPDFGRIGEPTITLTSAMQSRITEMQVWLVPYEEPISVKSISEQTISTPYFDLTGRAAAEPLEPGIYIHNGKKVVVR